MNWTPRDIQKKPIENALLLFYGKNEKGEIVYGWGTALALSQTLEKNPWISHWKIWEYPPSVDEEIVQVE